MPTHKILLRMPEDLRTHITAIVDDGQVAVFIREAVKNELDRRDKERGTD